MHGESGEQCCRFDALAEGAIPMNAQASRTGSQVLNLESAGLGYPPSVQPPKRQATHPCCESFRHKDREGRYGKWHLPELTYVFLES